MLALVTGAAGFIGSRLSGRLLAEGYDVIGLDALRPYYDVGQKRANLAALTSHERFRFIEADLLETDLTDCLRDVELVFHQAAQPGVRRSWGEFATYVRDNVEATQLLLAACLDAPNLRRVVYASSSSVYGNAKVSPVPEAALPAPRSPYGVTKLAAEHLTNLYADNFGLPTVSLRYFTVYGPGQRPDMATHRMIRAAAIGEPFPLYGDGSAVRDFTYVDDIVGANMLASSLDLESGSVFNVAGGGATSVRTLLELVGDAVGAAVPVKPMPEQPGDVQQTSGDTNRLHSSLGWVPSVAIEDGIKKQVAWQLELY